MSCKMLYTNCICTYLSLILSLKMSCIVNFLRFIVYVIWGQGFLPIKKCIVGIFCLKCTLEITNLFSGTNLLCVNHKHMGDMYGHNKSNALCRYQFEVEINYQSCMHEGLG